MTKTSERYVEIFSANWRDIPVCLTHVTHEGGQACKVEINENGVRHD